MDVADGGGQRQYGVEDYCSRGIVEAANVALKPLGEHNARALAGYDDARRRRGSRRNLTAAAVDQVDYSGST